MNTNESQCNDIQQILALGEKLSDKHIVHISGCDQCRMLQQNIEQLDGWLMEDKSNLVPDGFVDRVIEKLPETLRREDTPDIILGQRMLVAFSQSRVLQTALVGLGVAVGISHVIRFFLSIFITTMAAAS